VYFATPDWCGKWKYLYQEVLTDEEKEEFDVTRTVEMEKLLKVDVGPIYLALMESDLNRTQYGFLPLMASCSKSQIGACNAESFCERVISACNCICHKQNTNLSEDLLQKMVVLRINREFMKFMRENYYDEISKLKESTDLTETVMYEETKEEVEAGKEEGIASWLSDAAADVFFEDFFSFEN